MKQRYELILSGPNDVAPPLRRAWEDTPDFAIKIAGSMIKALRPGYRVTVELIAEEKKQ